MISDQIPLLGYHRKSWYVLMAFLASLFWGANALLAFAGLKIPLVYPVGFIERSYLIDVRGFTPESFGVILAAGGLTFLASVLVYAWAVGRFAAIEWRQSLYAMVALGVAAFPLSFYLYLDPGHPWWRLFVYISLFFTLLTIPFIEMLRRELEKRGIRIRLGGSR